MNFYTNISVVGSSIQYRGIENGKRVKRRLTEFSPTFFLIDDKAKTSEWKTLDGRMLKKHHPGSVQECRDFMNQYKGVSGFDIFGNINYDHAFIGETFPGEIQWDMSLIKVGNLDIETDSEGGYGDAEQGDKAITAICYKIDGIYHFFGYGNGDPKQKYVVHRPDVKYHECTDEVDMLEKFLKVWSANYPDIITGWNVRFYDIPYLINRLIRLLGEIEAKRISPWNYYRVKEVGFNGKDRQTYEISGITTYDYIELYKKFSPNGASQESHTLDNIASVELKEKKLSYEDYANLQRLYKENYQRFVEYNIKDVELVDRLDVRLKLIELVLTLAYDCKINYSDVFFQTKMWDALCYNFLWEEKIAIPQINNSHKNSMFEGAYVKEPIRGRHRWVVGGDFTSLYPFLQMMYNISPEKFWKMYDRMQIDKMIAKDYDLSFLQVDNITICPNGASFKRDSNGFFPKLLKKMFDERVLAKTKMINAKKAKEKETDKDKIQDFEREITRNNNIQWTKKICLNSLFGTSGNPAFRYFDIRLAEAITMSGQLAIQWVQTRINEYLNKLLQTNAVDYIVGSDTDSVYICLDELVKKTYSEEDYNSQDPLVIKKIIRFVGNVFETRVRPIIDKACEDLADYVNAHDRVLSMKREAIVDVGIWTAKKKYVLNIWDNEGVEFTNPDLKVVGLEVVRSSSPLACRKALKDAIGLMISGTEKQVQDYIGEFKKKFMVLPVEEIAFPRGMNGLDEYTSRGGSLWKTGTPIHVKGCIIYNHFLDELNLGKKYEKIQNGEKIKFVHLKDPNPFMCNVMAFPRGIPEEFKIEPWLDRNLQFDKSFVEPLKNIMEIIGWEIEKVSTLDSFFD